MYQKNVLGQIHFGTFGYLRPERLPRTGRMLHNKPMGSIPGYVPPKLRSSDTTETRKRNSNINREVGFFEAEDFLSTSNPNKEWIKHRM